MQAPSLDKLLTDLGKAGLLLGIATTLPYNCLYNVDGGERAVMFNRFGGIAAKPIGEGTHFRLPWFQTPFIYDIRTKPKVINTTTGTKDLQMVSISLRLLYKPNIDALPQIHKKMGPDFDERVLPSIGNEILKAVVARYDAENLLTQRDKVSHDIREAITARARQFEILLDDVAITHLAYGREYSKAIEEKQVAQQEAERSKFIVVKADQERKAAVIRAEGEAEAAEMISQALKEHGRGLIEVRKIDTSREVANSLSRAKNVTYLPSSGSNMLVNVGQV